LEWEYRLKIYLDVNIRFISLLSSACFTVFTPIAEAPTPQGQQGHSPQYTHHTGANVPVGAGEWGQRVPSVGRGAYCVLYSMRSLWLDKGKAQANLVAGRSVCRQQLSLLLATLQQ
jgi:hypothetical protein